MSEAGILPLFGGSGEPPQPSTVIRLSNLWKEADDILDQCAQKSQDGQSNDALATTQPPASPESLKTELPPVLRPVGSLPARPKASERSATNSNFMTRARPLVGRTALVGLVAGGIFMQVLHPSSTKALFEKSATGSLAKANLNSGPNLMTPKETLGSVPILTKSVVPSPVNVTPPASTTVVLKPGPLMPHTPNELAPAVPRTINVSLLEFLLRTTSEVANNAPAAQKSVAGKYAAFIESYETDPNGTPTTGHPAVYKSQFSKDMSLWLLHEKTFGKDTFYTPGQKANLVIYLGNLDALSTDAAMQAAAERIIHADMTPKTHRKTK